jgi:hypothetical protein
MSRRLTATQIIALGKYLNLEFDPTSLTVRQLLGVLGFHNIAFPSAYTKSKLVQVFNNEIKPNVKRFKKDRMRRDLSVASAEGIVDGLTGKAINGDKVYLPKVSCLGIKD